MKFSALCLFCLATAVQSNEIDKIVKGMSPRKGHSMVQKAMCDTKPLDANWLITKYNLNITDPEDLFALSQAVNGNLQLGSITQNIAEANDAGRVGALVIDGVSGDENFPWGKIKPLYTVGEINMCEENHGEVYVGVPDGMGAYLKDDDTLRIVVQSESYGPLRYESYPYYVNGNGASFTGSHVQYTDFDREGLSEFLTHSGAASEIIKGFGQVAKTYYNLAGELVAKRVEDGPTTYGAHFSNTDAAGNYVVANGAPTQADWLMQSLCSSHLEEAHQWGEGIGLEDDMYITNEEWITYVDGSEFVGISMHAMDLANQVDYAVGSVTNTGWEKIVEINPQHPDYVILSVSGYNGAYSGNSAELNARNAEYGPRPDGTDYVWTRDICPARIYIGLKGKMEDGSDAPADDFLARNGLRYGKVYGFVTDMSESGDAGGLWRDAFHKPRGNGAKVDGKFVAIDWQWDGEVRNYRHDGGWEFQLPVPGYEDTDMKWWNAKGYDASGSKTEHNSPDTRPGITGFIQGSTAGYFGHYYIHDVLDALTADGDFPSELDSTYYVYQGENDITGQIDLNGAGLFNMVEECDFNPDALKNCDNPGSVKSTFEDIDGLEVIAAKEGLFAVIQEDSGSELGERMFISSVLEHEDDGNELGYHLMAISGGKFNTRMDGLVGIPVGTNDGGGSHEFSGVIDLSGMLAKKEHRRKLKKGGKDRQHKTKEPLPTPVPRTPVPRTPAPIPAPVTPAPVTPSPTVDDSVFVISAHDGAAKREAEHEVSINDKLIALGLQAHNLDAGVVRAFQADRGGQVMVYQPDL